MPQEEEEEGERQEKARGIIFTIILPMDLRFFLFYELLLIKYFVVN